MLPITVWQQQFLRANVIPLHINVVHSTWNQGHPRFGISAGRQCVCAALSFAMHSKVMPLNAMDTNTLDTILCHGSMLYVLVAARAKRAYLMVNDLPPTVELRGIMYGVVHNDGYYGGIAMTNRDGPFTILSEAVRRCFIQYTVALYTMGYMNQNAGDASYTSCIAYENGLFYVFDSHARDNHGLQSDIGRCCMLTFDCVDKLICYLQHLAHSANMANECYELTPIQIIHSLQPNMSTVPNSRPTACHQPVEVTSMQQTLFVDTPKPCNMIGQEPNKSSSFHGDVGSNLYDDSYSKCTNPNNATNFASEKSTAAQYKHIRIDVNNRMPTEERATAEYAHGRKTLTVEPDKVTQTIPNKVKDNNGVRSLKRQASSNDIDYISQARSKLKHSKLQVPNEDSTLISNYFNDQAKMVPKVAQPHINVQCASALGAVKGSTKSIAQDKYKHNKNSTLNKPTEPKQPKSGKKNEQGKVILQKAGENKEGTDISLQGDVTSRVLKTDDINVKRRLKYNEGKMGTAYLKMDRRNITRRARNNVLKDPIQGNVVLTSEEPMNIPVTAHLNCGTPNSSRSTLKQNVMMDDTHVKRRNRYLKNKTVKEGEMGKKITSDLKMDEKNVLRRSKYKLAMEKKKASEVHIHDVIQHTMDNAADKNNQGPLQHIDIVPKNKTDASKNCLNGKREIRRSAVSTTCHNSGDALVNATQCPVTSSTEKTVLVEPNPCNNQINSNIVNVDTINIQQTNAVHNETHYIHRPKNADDLVENFLLKTKNACTNVCACCNQLFYKHSVKPISRLKNVTNVFMKSMLATFNESKLICNTCKRYIDKLKVPPCSVANGTKFNDLPDELSELHQLELRLLAPRLPFMQIRAAPSGQQYKLAGNVVNVIADVVQTVTMLPRLPNNDATIKVKLKRMLQFKHHVLCENVRPAKVSAGAHWLVNNGELYKKEHIEFDPDWLDEQGRQERDIAGENNHLILNEEELHEIGHVNVTKTSNTTLPVTMQDGKNKMTNATKNNDDEDTWSENGDPHDNVGATDTMLSAPDFVEDHEQGSVLSVAPAEGSTPMSIFTDKYSEELAFPGIYSGQARPQQRLVPIYYSEIVKCELRNKDRRVCKYIDNLFFKLKKTQMKAIMDRVTLAIRKHKPGCSPFSAKDVKGEGYKNVIHADEGYQILNKVRGSPPYFEKAKQDLFAMIRHLGPATLFLTFSAAETKWGDLLQTLSKLVDNKALSDDQIKTMPWQVKCRLIQSDPVTCARHFDYQLNAMINDVLKSPHSPIGQVTDMFNRIEFQQRGSPHAHMLVWIEGAPKYGINTDEEVVAYVDSIMTCHKPENDDIEMADLVKLQTHRHSKACKRGKSNICRFGFLKPPMARTRFLKPLDEDTTANMRKQHVTDYDRIQQALLAIDDDRPSYEDFIHNLNLTEDLYILAVRSSIKSVTLFLQRQPCECRINGYNKHLLKSWKANHDVQYITDVYACAMYVAAYISKSQRGMSLLLREACAEARDQSSDIRQQVRIIGNKFLNNIEVSAQEAVYILLQLPMRKASRTIVFVNTGPPEQRVSLLKPKQMLDKLEDDDTDIHADNLLNRYEKRSDKLSAICLAEFAAWYDLRDVSSTPRERKAKPDGFLAEISTADDVIDNAQNDDNNHDSVNEEVPVPKKEQSTKKRKVGRVLRTVRFNVDKSPDNHYRELIMLYTTWRNESTDLIGAYSSYKERYLAEKEVIDAAHNLMEPASEAVDIAMNTDVNDEMEDEWNRLAPTATQLNAEDRANECPMPQPTEQYDIGVDLGVGVPKNNETEMMPKLLLDNEYRELVQGLNRHQTMFFNDTLHALKTATAPTFRFLSGGAGVGKSLLTKALYQALLRHYNTNAGEDFDALTILLLAPTGKAAYLIGGNTIHSALKILPNQNLQWRALSSANLNTLRVKYQHLKVIFIDEISMVGHRMFKLIHQRLQEIMSSAAPFGGVSIIAVGDLYQLKPVLDGHIFANHADGYGALACNLWTDHFKLFELQEIMRQRDSQEFAHILNRLREGIHTNSDLAVLQRRKVANDDSTLQSHTHLFLTNDKVNTHNTKIYNQQKANVKYLIQAKDSVIGNVPDALAENLLNRIPTDAKKTAQLPTVLEIALNLPYDITHNINIEDGLVNGASGTVKMVQLYQRQAPFHANGVIWLELPAGIGQHTRTELKHLYTKDTLSNWTPIIPLSLQFKVGKNKDAEINRKQFPLRCAAAKTVHRSQGSTMENIVVDLSGRKNPHMHYVALSRVTTLEGLNIIDLSPKNICIDSNVKTEMQRLRTQATIVPTTVVPKNGGQTIIFLNCRSLHRHITDIRQDYMLLEADILIFAESRLTHSDNSADYEIPGYTMYRFDEKTTCHRRPYHGLCLYTKHPINAATMTSVTFQETELLVFNLTVANYPLTVIGLYKAPTSANTVSIEHCLSQVHNMFDNNVVIVGDFNLNWNHTQHRIKLNSLMEPYNMIQIQTDTTTDYGSILDLVFTRTDNLLIATSTLECYYSDHKPICISIT